MPQSKVGLDVSYGVEYHRLAVRLLETRLQSDLADLQTVKREIKAARTQGELSTKFTNKRRSIARSIVRTRRDMERMQGLLQKREEWERADGS